jgi:hypothetical protein
MTSRRFKIIFSDYGFVSLDQKYDPKPLICHQFFNLTHVLLYLTNLNQSFNPQ